jgi:hypothetical protein
MDMDMHHQDSEDTNQEVMTKLHRDSEVTKLHRDSEVKNLKATVDLMVINSVVMNLAGMVSKDIVLEAKVMIILEVVS